MENSDSSRESKRSSCNGCRTLIGIPTFLASGATQGPREQESLYMGIIAFIIIGLIAGLIARAILPGRQSMGLVATTLLGMVGSLVGGLVGSLFVRDGRLFDLRPSGIIMSVIGAIVVLLLVGATGRRRIHA
jgi:uncharacterized membrane protein YeaQ/YmgE (transglycosylase-associated protein family)